MNTQFLPDGAPPTQVEVLLAAQYTALEQQHWDGIGSVWHDVKEAMLVFRVSEAKCRGDSCSCLDLQACLQRLLERAAEVQPLLGTMVDLKAHMALPTYCSYIPNCPHAAAARLAVADAYYKLIALPDYTCRARAAAAHAPARAPATAWDAVTDRRIEHFLCSGKNVLYYPPAQRQALQSQWTKVLRRLQKAAEALPPNNQPLSPTNASRLSKWICEGPNGIDSKLHGLLHPSHTLILWSAAACRVCRNNLLTTDLGDPLLRPVAAVAAALLDVTCTMGRLSAAGISFNTQPSPAAVAAAIDLAAQVNAALMPFLYKRMVLEQEQQQQQQQQQRRAPLPLPPLYLSPLQQQQEEMFKQEFLSMGPTIGNQQFEDIITVAACGAFQKPQQFGSLGAPLICVHGQRLLQQWEQQLQQQGAEPPAVNASHAVAAAGASSSSSRPAWQEAEGLLLLGAAAMEGPIHGQQQQLQQQLALCRQYQQQFQQAATKLGLSSELMAAVAAWFTGAEQYSSSSSDSSGSEGAAAGSAAASDCLAVVWTAALLLELVFPLVDPNSQTAEHKQQQLFTPAEELLVAGFFLQVPGLLSATAVAAVMQTQPVGAPAAAAAAADAGPCAVLSQLPMLVQSLRLCAATWPSANRLLCAEFTAAEQAAVSSPKQQQQQQQSGKHTAPSIGAARVLLGSTSILLQQLLRMAAAAAADAQQRQLATPAILYLADALGARVQAFWFDLRAKEAQDNVDDGLLLYSNENASTLARAVQAFEAAVRHLMAAVPPIAAGSTLAAQPPASTGSTVPAGSSSSGSSRSMISSSSSSRPLTPASIQKIEEAAIGFYCSLLYHARGEGCSSGGRSSSSNGLGCPQQQLLQASLSMLLTACKLWQSGLERPLPSDPLQYLAGKAALHMQCVSKQEQPAGYPRGAPTSAAAAALDAFGGVQVCHLVARYFCCCEWQLRQLVAFGDAKCAVQWLTGSSDGYFTPLPCEPSAAAAAAGIGAGAAAPSCLQALGSLVEAVCTIGPGSWDGLDAPRVIHLQRSELKSMYDSIQVTLQSLLSVSAAIRAGNKADSTILQGLELGCELLESLGNWAEHLKRFGDVVAAALPSWCGCNWPGCVRLSGVSEGYGLVRGQACVCGGCRQARYCSVACQAAHWPVHKAFCYQHQQRQQQQQKGEEAAISVAETAAH